MEKMCLRHRQTPSSTMCHECHKPICRSCIMVTPVGSFCSSECDIMFREMKKRIPKASKVPGGKAVLLGLCLVVLAFFLIHLAARSNPKLKEYDVIGRFLGRGSE